MSKEKKIFIIRLILFAIFSCILPITFIAYRYDIFKAKPIALTGWGFIAIIIVFFFVKDVLGALKQCFPHTMMSQCISGFCKVVLPLGVLLLMLQGIKENIDAFIQALTITILCECVAIPINPLPKFMWDNHIERENARMDTFFTKFKDSWKEANNKQIESK